MATWEYPRPAAARTMSRRAARPSLYVVCIWRSLRRDANAFGLAARVRRASAIVRNPRRISGGSMRLGGSASGAEVGGGVRGVFDIVGDPRPPLEKLGE